MGIFFHLIQYFSDGMRCRTADGQTQVNPKDHQQNKEIFRFKFGSQFWSNLTNVCSTSILNL